MAQLVEHNLAKVGVAGSSPVVRSIACIGPVFESALFISTAKWPSGKAEACKAFTPGSNPGFASRSPKGPSFPEGPFSLRGTGFGPHWRRGTGETRGVFQRSAQGAARAAASAGGAAARGIRGGHRWRQRQVSWEGRPVRTRVLFQMKRKIPFSTCLRRPKRDFLLHLGSGEDRGALAWLVSWRRFHRANHYLSITHQLYVSLHMWSIYPLLKKSSRSILSQ